MIFPIIQHPDMRLRRIADPVADIAAMQGRPTWETTIAWLLETFESTRGRCVGLAAPQLGIALRIIVVDVTPSRNETILMVNPTIDRASQDAQSVLDGCLSIRNGNPDTYRRTKRPKRIEVSWFGADGAPHKGKFTGFIAAAVHHEVDHLDGVLFIDRIGQSTKAVAP